MVENCWSVYGHQFKMFGGWFIFYSAAKGYTGKYSANIWLHDINPARRLAVAAEGPKVDIFRL